MKKKTIANLVMVALILVIAAAGVLGVGHIQGWFDKVDTQTAFLTQIRGIVSLEREGVVFAVQEDTALRSGDKITCDPGATAQIRVGEDYMTLGQSACATVTEPSANAFGVSLSQGEAFISADASLQVSFDGKRVDFAGSVATLSVRSGAQSISVYAGHVEDAQAGQSLQWIGQERSVEQLAIDSLNDFNIAQLRVANQRKMLCYSDADLDRLEADRWAQRQEQLEPSVPESTGTTPSESTQPSQDTQAPAASDPAPSETQQTEPSQSQPTQPTETQPTEPAYAGYVTITIRCDTILNNWDKLDPAKAGYVPSSGVILPSVQVGFQQGETVFDVLSRVCDAYGIQLEYSWTPMYNSYYIEGINHLYEFDCGYESGWMYKVNGWFPNYGCSSYTLTGGEDIVWCYTCVGLGADVGGSNW